MLQNHRCEICRLNCFPSLWCERLCRRAVGSGLRTGQSAHLYFISIKNTVQGNELGPVRREKKSFCSLNPLIFNQLNKSDLLGIIQSVQIFLLVETSHLKCFHWIGNRYLLYGIKLRIKDEKKSSFCFLLFPQEFVFPPYFNTRKTRK